MEFRVLGPLEVVGDEGPVTIAGRRQRALLAALLASAGSPVSTDALVELLWGSDQPADPAAALHSQVARLRRAIGERVETRPSGYALTAGPDELDAARFEALLEEDPEPVRAVAALDEALALWRGPAYAEFADVEPARLEALRLDELRAEAGERRGELLLDLGRSLAAVPALEVLVAANPLRERALALLMRALHLSGRQPDALARYDAYRRHLAGELGLEPSPTLRALHAEILRDEAAEPPRPGLGDLAIRYVRGLAVGTAGAGPPLVVPPAWVSSLDVIAAGRDPRSSLLDRLAGERTVTLYDRAGTGLSAALPPDPSLAATVAELETVIESAGGPVPVLAVSQAGPPALALAARRPDLVSHLVLWGTYATGGTVFTDPRLRASVVEMIRAHWGMAARLLASLYRPGAGDEAALHFARVLRDSAPADVAADYLEAVYAADVGPELARITAPALVMHYRGDRVIPFAGAQQLTAGLPGARLLVLDGAFHLPDARDLPRIVEAIRGFLA